MPKVSFSYVYTLIGFAVALLLPAPATAAAQDELNGRLIRRMEFGGLERLGEDYVRRLLKTREGEALNLKQLQEDANELLRSRRFLTVQAIPTPIGDQVDVRFELREKPTVASLEITGNSAFTTEELQKELEFAQGGTLDEYLVTRGRDEILQKYRDAGYADVTVEFDRELVRNENRVVYTISEGIRVRVRAVEFEGNTAFPDGELRGKVSTQTYLWPFRTSAFDSEQAQRDAAELQRFYRSAGFLDAKVGYRAEKAPGDVEALQVFFDIEEGQRYRVGRVDLKGVSALGVEGVRSQIRTQSESTLDTTVLDADVKRIEDYYGESGYVDTRCSVETIFAKEPGVANVVFTIDEAPLVKFGRITIRGNERTKDEVIRRELKFVPGDTYNTALTRKAEKRLRELGLFNQATITPLPPEVGEREALVEVTEADAVNILFGVGVSTDNGLLGSVTLENRNFDLFDWPRTWEQFLRGQSFRGDGQRLSIRLEPGNELSRFRIDFTEPYLFDKQVRFDWSAYYFQREREGYQEDRLGMLVGLSRRFEEGLLAGWAIEGTLRLENVGVEDVDFLAPSDIREARGDSTLVGGRVGLVRDTTDSRLLPTEGYRFTISLEQVGGDYSYTRPSTSFTWYKTLHTDALERKSVLALRADASGIVGDAPVFDRFYAGGFGSIRGFNFRGVSPRKGVLDTPVGGDFVLLTGAEYSFPLYAETVRGVTFLDMGTVEEDYEITDWRASVGFGLRVNVDFFGPVPLVFDFGFPIAEAEDDDKQVFNFTFGASF
ncbi:MAG: outer membrane protein assembly factor BamA [Phycisphaerae bacterium]|nr:outer membrane protein assembly factor BamA [Phycisphaerae bacterium]